LQNSKFLGKLSIFDYARGMISLVFWVALAFLAFSYMTLWFGMALYTKRYDVVDSAWGLGFVLLAWSSIALLDSWQPIALISAWLVSLWGLRLFAHIARRNWSKHSDDHRYEELRRGWGKHERSRAYTNVFMLQAALLLMISTPMVAIAMATEATVNAGVVVGWCVWLFGIGFETLADYQLGRFLRERPAGSHALMDKGLWRYSRHPNYFGEIATWAGAATVAVSVGGWWGVLGALTITYLLVKVSGIPPLERHYAGNKAYQAYAKRTSILVPLPPKKA
jgi:steroid 5-alpha reductase family enzyme